MEEKGERAWHEVVSLGFEGKHEIQWARDVTSARVCRDKRIENARVGSDELAEFVGHVALPWQRDHTVAVGHTAAVGDALSVCQRDIVPAGSVVGRVRTMLRLCCRRFEGTQLGCNLQCMNIG
jgi:hypothetical protein